MILPTLRQFEREKAQSCRVRKLIFCNAGMCRNIVRHGETPNTSPAHCHTCTPSPMRRLASTEPAHFCFQADDELFHVTTRAAVPMWDRRGSSLRKTERADTCRSSNSPPQPRHWPSSQAALIQTPNAPSQALLPGPWSRTPRAEARQQARSSGQRLARSATTRASATENSRPLTRSEIIETPCLAAPGRGVLL